LDLAGLLETVVGGLGRSIEERDRSESQLLSTRKNVKDEGEKTDRSDGRAALLLTIRSRRLTIGTWSGRSPVSARRRRSVTVRSGCWTAVRCRGASVAGGSRGSGRSLIEKERKGCYRDKLRIEMERRRERKAYLGIDPLHNPSMVSLLRTHPDRHTLPSLHLLHDHTPLSPHHSLLDHTTYHHTCLLQPSLLRRNLSSLDSCFDPYRHTFLRPHRGTLHRHHHIDRRRILLVLPEAGTRHAHLDPRIPPLLLRASRHSRFRHRTLHLETHPDRLEILLDLVERLGRRRRPDDCTITIRREEPTLKNTSQSRRRERSWSERGG
jgi:hypothetical protein